MESSSLSDKVLQPSSSLSPSPYLECEGGCVVASSFNLQQSTTTTTFTPISNTNTSLLPKQSSDLATAFLRTMQHHHQQPSGMSTSTFATTTTSSFQSPGMMDSSMGFPFDPVQWNELERQAMVYKYMDSASVPVPFQFLMPISSSSTSTATHPPYVISGGSGVSNQTRHSSRQDTEPGRCKRTDGKKWRCSRDVAPYQKYCERHLHRGRPRSRKHVEVRSNKDCLHQETSPPALQSSLSPGSSTIPSNEATLLFDHTNCVVNTSASPSIESNRGFDWRLGSEMLAANAIEQQPSHVMQNDLGWSSVYNTNPSAYQQDFGLETLNFFADTFCGLETLDKDSPREDIDAWSNNNLAIANSNVSSITSSGNLSPSSLTLSMAIEMGKLIDEELDQIQMGFGDEDPVQLSSLVQPVSWGSSASIPGGPLAEVLRASAVGTSSIPASPHVGDCDCISPAVTTVSSPSEVLHRPMLSLSDNSVCNSPTIATSSSAATELLAFRWLGQN